MGKNHSRMALGKDGICNGIFNCTYVTIKNFHMDGLWENMNNLWVYDPIILISMITLNHGRNTVCQKARLIISFYFLGMYIVCSYYCNGIYCSLSYTSKMSNMSPFRLFVRPTLYV